MNIQFNQKFEPNINFLFFVILGVINSEGDLWKSQRRFLINHKLGMRHWGHDMGQIENRIEHETAELLNTFFTQHADSPVNPASIVNCAVSNVICSMIMSTRFEHTNPEFRKFIHNFDEGFRLFSQTGSLMFLPFLKYLPGVNTACQQLAKNRAEMLEFVRTIIDGHKEDIDPSHPRDLIDSYLVTIEQMKNDDR